MTTGYLGDSGIILNGAADSEGVIWSWTDSDPWTPGPSLRDSSGENAGDHGSWDATRFFGPRNYSLEGRATAPDHTALHRAKSRLFAACGLGFDFRIVEPGYDRTARFRRNGEPRWSEDVSLRRAVFSVPLWAGDPRAYSTTVHTVTAAFPSTSGGLVWPATWPATWAATVVDGTLSLPNVGTETSWPKFRIDGPVVNPRVVNTLTGEQMVLTMTLLAGEWVTINTATHQVLALDDPAASRREKFTGTWFGLAPGANTVRFDGLSAGAGAGLTAIYQDVWI